MTHRRNFLKITAGATAGIFLRRAAEDTRVFSFQASSPGRREVFVGGRRVKVVDIHGHFIAPEELELVKDTPLSGNIQNNLNGPLVLGPPRLRTLDQQGIDVQVLSHQGGWWYGLGRTAAERLIQVQNESLARWCRAHAERFAGLASVALQFPDLAAEQLETAVKSLGLRGAGISGHVGGEDPSSRKFDPFWAKAEELGIMIFVHPDGARNVIREGALEGRGDLGNIIGNPLETTVFLSRMIFEGTLDRFPGLKICAAHAGGYLPSYLGRTDVACAVRPVANCANKKSAKEYFKRELLVDSMIFSAEGLRHLVAEVGASQVVYGTDAPYNWPLGLDLIAGATFLSDAEKEAILGGNLVRLLRIPS
jgi:aminocarboxymuconate-semialdehyde decarboxylase